MGNHPPAARVLHVALGADPPDRLDKALARDVPEEAALSRSRLMRLIAEGAVTRGGVAVTDPKARVAAGDGFEITLGEALEVATAARGYPADRGVGGRRPDRDRQAGGHGRASRAGVRLGARWSMRCFTISAARLSGVGGEKRPGIVHRIDKDTSGLLVVAKSDRAHHGLAAQFETHDGRTGAIWRSSMACRMRPIRGCAASRGVSSNRAAS